MALQILTAAAVLATLLHFRPPTVAAPLYRPRRFESGAVKGWSPAATLAAAGPDPIHDAVVHNHIPMTTGEFARIVTDARVEDARALDRIEDEFRAGLEWLEATVMLWLDEDVESEHARVWAQTTGFAGRQS
jgi:hypothetical protein